MQITAHCAIRSRIYGHILVLNLQSMCAAHLGKTPLLFWFLTYCAHLPNCLCSSWFLRLDPLFVFCFFTNFVDLFPHVCYSCVHFYQQPFYFQIVNTAPFHSMIMTCFLCLYSLFFFLNRRLIFYDTVYFISLPVWISVFNFPRNWRFYWVASLICDSSCDIRILMDKRISLHGSVNFLHNQLQQPVSYLYHH
jgi:hypothetical protein